MKVFVLLPRALLSPVAKRKKQQKKWIKKKVYNFCSKLKLETPAIGHWICPALSKAFRPFLGTFRYEITDT